MIKPRYILRLARTRLHYKRGMLLGSIAISSMLFAIVVAGMIVYAGADKSAIAFIRAVSHDKYLVETTPVVPENALTFPTQLSLEDVKAIKAYEKNYYDQLKAKHKTLSIQYDSSTEVLALTPSSWRPKSLPEEQRVDINFESPVIKQLLKEKYAAYVKTATNTVSNLRALGTSYGAKGFYTTTSLGLPGIPNQMLIANGKENFEDQEIVAGDMTPYGYSINAVHNGIYQFEDQNLLDRYLTIKDSKNLKGIPVVISAQEAVALFGAQLKLNKEPTTETQRVNWLKSVQTATKGFTYDVCYRNSTEVAKIQKIQQDYSVMTNHKNDQNYTKPTLIYDLPKNPCGDVVVLSDTRSVAEKKTDQQDIDNQKKLGTYIEPVHKVLKFQIVGVVNMQPIATSYNSVLDYAKQLMTPRLSLDGVAIPRQMYDGLSKELRQDGIIPPQSSENALARTIIEFDTIQSARMFIEKETCPVEASSCNRPYQAKTYGSNYLLLEDFGKVFKQTMLYVLPAVIGLAAITLWLTMARVLAESRKETAVYRSMGAKRSHIASIYVVYAMIIALRIALISYALGAIISLVINIIYGPVLANAAAISFGVIDSVSPSVSLFGVDFGYLSLVLVAVIGVVSLAIVQPIIRNVLRPPVEDIRTE